MGLGKTLGEGLGRGVCHVALGHQFELAASVAEPLADFLWFDAFLVLDEEFLGDGGNICGGRMHVMVKMLLEDCDHHSSNYIPRSCACSGLIFHDAIKLIPGSILLVTRVSTAILEPCVELIRSVRQLKLGNEVLDEFRGWVLILLEGRDKDGADDHRVERARTRHVVFWGSGKGR